MILRDLLRAELPQAVPSLLATHTVTLLTFATADEAWAAGAAWDVARAAARAGRRTVLVDLGLERPSLHQGATAAAEVGIVDAFLFETSLNHVARVQDVRDLHFIAAGTMAPNPREVWGHPRWTRLARGFAQEGALLLLFAPLVALPHLAVPADGVCLLAGEGFDPADGALDELRTATTRDRPILGLVTERPRAARISLGVERRTWPRVRALTPALALGVVLLASLGAGGYLLGWGRRAHPATPVRSSGPRPAPLADGDRPYGDTLYYSVQIAAFQVLSQAMALSQDFERSGFLAPVTPVRAGNDGVWYRVMVGAAHSPGQADSLLRELWYLGLVEPSQGSILRTPQALALGVWGSVAEAREALKGLRERGVPAYIVPRPDGTARLLVGAFADPDQAEAADSLLAAAGLTHTLVPRSGIAR